MKELKIDLPKGPVGYCTKCGTKMNIIVKPYIRDIHYNKYTGEVLSSVLCEMRCPHHSWLHPRHDDQVIWQYSFKDNKWFWA